MTQLALDGIGPAPVQRILEAFERRHGSYMDGARHHLRRLAIREGREVSSDDFWALIEEGVVPPLPEGVHSNAVGALFRHGPFRPVGWTRSARPSSHGNPLRTWEPAA